jgi:molybdate transport system ATP-binding protein
VPLIELSSASLHLNDRAILQNINFNLERFEVMWLRGANGAGKSTLLKLLRGDQWHTSGKRLYHFTDPPRQSPIGAKERIALVTPEMQDRYQRLAYSGTGLEVVQTGFAHTDYLYTPLSTPQRARAETFMHELQLEALTTQPVNTMSQGQLRQILLTRALVGKPDVLLLDEFFASVDAEARDRLRTLVNDFARAGLTLVYTTHRDEERLEATTREVWLEGGRVVNGSRTKTYRPTVGAQPAAPLHPTGQQDEILLEVQHANVFLGDPRDDHTAVDGHALNTKKHVLHDVSFSLARGRHTVLIGANGAGKTTLSRVLLGELCPALGGVVRWFGSERTPLWERQARIGIVSSLGDVRHRVDADGFTMVASGFSGGTGWHRALEDEERERVHDLMTKLEISHLEARDALTVSQGELRKLLIARALVTEPDVLILDEAFDYLDAISRTRLFDVLETLAHRVTFLVIAHHLQDVPRWVSRTVRLEAGRVVAEGAMHELEV